MRPLIPQACFDPHAAYVLVGGLGGLGRSILSWMARRGARFLKVLSRSKQIAKATQETLADLKTQGVFVDLFQCDVTSATDVDSVIAQISEQQSIRGILHAAVVLEVYCMLSKMTKPLINEFQDKIFDRLSHNEWNRGLAAKVTGTLNLHEATLRFKLPLDFFVMTSSIQTIIAQATQAAYSAANNFQDAFARYRRRLGLPGHSIAFGVINEVEGLGQTTVTQKSLIRNRLYATGENDFLRLLETAFLSQPEEPELLQYDPLANAQTITCLDPHRLAKKQAAANKSNPTSFIQPEWQSDPRLSGHLQLIEDILSDKASSHAPSQPSGSTSTATIDTMILEGEIAKAQSLVTEMIVERIAELLLIKANTIDPRKGVTDYGIDSLIGVELRGWFVRVFSVEVSFLELLDSNTSIEDLAQAIIEERVARVDQRVNT